jgi:hypothetical protein
MSSKITKARSNSSVVKLVKTPKVEAAAAQQALVTTQAQVVADDSDSEFSSSGSESSHIAALLDATCEKADEDVASNVYSFPSFVQTPTKRSTIYTLTPRRNKTIAIPSGYLLAAHPFLVKPAKRAAEDEADDARLCRIGKYVVSREEYLVFRQKDQETAFEPARIKQFLDVLIQKDDDERKLAIAAASQTILHLKQKAAVEQKEAIEL